MTAVPPGLFQGSGIRSAPCVHNTPVTTSPDVPSRPATTRARWFAAELTMATQDLGPVHEATGVAPEVTPEHGGIGCPFASSDEQ